MSERDDDQDVGLDDGLLSELDEFDKMFDALHDPSTEVPVAAEADPPSVEEIDWELPGAAPEAAAAEAPATAALPALEEAAGFPPPVDEFESPFADSTAIASPEELARLAGAELSGEPEALGGLLGGAADGDDETLFTSAPRPEDSAPPAWARAMPADPGEAAIDDFGGSEKTNVLAPELLERMAESAEAFFADDDEPVLELDDDFYAGIEIDEAATPSSEAGAGSGSLLGDGPRRATTAHILRRERRSTAPQEPPSSLLQPLGDNDDPAEFGRQTTAVKAVPAELLDRTSGTEVTKVRRSSAETLSDAGEGAELDADLFDFGPEQAEEEPLDFDRPPPAEGFVGTAKDEAGYELDFDEADEDRFELEVPPGAGELEVLPPTLDSNRALPERDAEPELLPPTLAMNRALPERDDEAVAEFEAAPPTVAAIPALDPADPASAGDSGEFAFEVDAAVDSMVTVPRPASLAPERDDDQADPRLGGVVEAAFDEAVSLSTGTLLTGPNLVEVDVPPDLPASPFAGEGPVLDLGAIRVPESAELADDDRTDELARELLLYERELELSSEPEPSARLRIEAGRLAEALGDLDRARTHHDTALELDPRLSPALRAVRRIERTLANWEEVANQPAGEGSRASPIERRALIAHRADLLMALGEQDLARVAVGELLDGAPGDVRALFANLELAYVDGRDDEVAETLARLAAAIGDDQLRASLEIAAAQLGDATGKGAEPRRRAIAAVPGAVGAQLGLAALAERDGDLEAAAAAYADAAEAARERDPALAAGLSWRWAELAGRRGDAAERARALDAAGEGEPWLVEARARACAQAGDRDTAATLWADCGQRAGVPALRARALRRAATLTADADRALALVREAVEADPHDPMAAADLALRLTEAGDIDGLVALDRAGGRHLAAAARLAAAGRAAEALAELSREEPSWARDLLLVRSGSAAERARALAAVADSDAAHVHPAGALRRAAQACELAALAAGAAAPEERAAEPGDLSALALDRDDAADELPTLVRADDAAAPLALDGDDELPTIARDRSGDAAADDEAPTVALDRDDAGDDDAPTVDLERAAIGGDGALGQLARAAYAEPAAETPSAAALDIERAALRAEAVALWRRALELDPEIGGAARALARLTASAADLAAAQAAAGDAAARVGYALRQVPAALEAGDVDAVEELCRGAAIEAAADPRPVALLAAVLAAAGRWDDAAAVWAERADAIADASPAEADRLRFRAAAALVDAGGDLGRAAELAEAVVDRRPGFAAAGELLASIRASLGAAAGVSAVAPGTVAQAELDELSAAIRAGDLAEAAGDPAAAAASYRRALELAPGDPMARAGFSRVAAAADEVASLASFVLADLEAAETAGDAAAKADACEELARIDGELRGDRESALFALESAASADPERAHVLRALERAYAARERHGDLADLYRLAAAAATDEEAAVYFAEAARLGARAGRSAAAVLADYREARDRDARNRAALCHLEAAARAEPPSADLAALEEAIADYFAGDDRARAAFLVRAGETQRQLGDLDAAIERFSRALDVVPGFPPALAEWREASLDAERWDELAQGAEREAQSLEPGDTQAALYHLAGVVYMDRAGDDERAAEALRRALVAAPGHRDAFVRLRRLYEGAGRDADLAEICRARLEVESDAAALIELHRVLAELHQGEALGDLEAARTHLRAIAELDPAHLGALAGLADIAWQRRDWAEAAEALMARARVDKDPAALSETFFRLGTIYAEHTPDARWALKSFQRVLAADPGNREALVRIADLATQTGQYRMALGACEQLIKLDPPVAEKVEHLHRAARIYGEGLGEPENAERALRIALDLDPSSDAALDALLSFCRDKGDLASARVHLDRVCAAMRGHSGPDAYRVLARALAARAEAGVAGSLAGARAAAELARATGAEHPQLSALTAQPPRPIVGALAGGRLDDVLFPPSVPPDLRAIFSLLGERLAKHVGIDLRRHGVGRGDKLRKGTDPISTAVLELAAEMGVGDVDVYVSSKQPTVAAAEPASPVALILGRDLVSLDRPAELRFWVGRQLLLARTQLAVPAQLGPGDFGVLLAGLLRQFSPNVVLPGLDEGNVANQQQRLRRLIPSALLQELGPLALGLANAGLDHVQIWRGILAAADRAGFLAAGSAAASVTALSRAGGYRDIHQGLADPAIRELAAFAVGEDHVRVAAALGI